MTDDRVREAMAAAVAHIRELAQSSRPRTYHQGDSPDKSSGGRSLFESVEFRGGLTVIRQLEIRPDGRVLRYWWGHLEDDEGGLTDRDLSPETAEPALLPLAANEFDRCWDQSEQQ